LSLINIFAKRNTITQSPEQMIPEKDKRASASPKYDKRSHKIVDHLEKRKESRKKDQR
jgi:hypothetical protein